MSPDYAQNSSSMLQCMPMFYTEHKRMLVQVFLPWCPVCHYFTVYLCCFSVISVFKQINDCLIDWFLCSLFWSVELLPELYCRDVTKLIRPASIHVPVYIKTLYNYTRCSTKDCIRLLVVDVYCYCWTRVARVIFVTFMTVADQVVNRPVCCLLAT